MTDLFTYAEAQRDRALHQVTRQDWMPAAIGVFRRHCRELPDIFTGEDIRELVTAYAGSPHHPNAWGALTMALSRQGMIVPTGTVAKMKSAKSHARRTFEYRLAA